jgi:hypothetical protein
VLWQWSGESFAVSEIEKLEKAAQSLKGELRTQLSALLSEQELDALAARVNRLLAESCFPHPNPNWPAVPWPAF